MMIESAPTSCRGRVSGALGAAARLGIPRSTLESKIRALEIDKHRFSRVGRLTAGELEALCRKPKDRPAPDSVP